MNATRRRGVPGLRARLEACLEPTAANATKVHEPIYRRAPPKGSSTAALLVAGVRPILRANARMGSDLDAPAGAGPARAHPPCPRGLFAPTGP
jgi:hypothetical protein